MLLGSVIYKFVTTNMFNYYGIIDDAVGNSYGHPMIAMLPSDLGKLHWERLSVKGELPEVDWLNYAVKEMTKWIDQRPLTYLYYTWVTI